MQETRLLPRKNMEEIHPLVVANEVANTPALF